MYDLKDKVVLITGAAKGIGAAVAREMLKEGAKHVRLLDIDEKAGIKLQKELNDKFGANKAKFVQCDVTKNAELFSAFVNTKDEQGYLDVVVNNAGTATEPDYAAIRKQIEINVIAVITGSLKAIELMDKSKGGRGGTVINMASIAGLYPIAAPLPSYSATKSAVLQFTSCLGMQQHEDIRLIDLCFGSTDTEIFDSMSCFAGSGQEDTLAEVMANFPKQTVESAARGTIQAYKKGKNTSTWLIYNNQPAIDISEAREKCHKIMENLLL